MELYEQQELAEKQAEKKNYERKRHARLAEAQKLEANETRLKEQYERRQLQYKTSGEQEKFAQKKVISRILSKQYLKSVRSNTYLVLEEEGFFRQPLQTDLYEDYTPWIYKEILEQLKKNREFGEEIHKMVDEAKN